MGTISRAHSAGETLILYENLMDIDDNMRKSMTYLLHTIPSTIRSAMYVAIDIYGNNKNEIVPNE